MQDSLGQIEIDEYQDTFYVEQAAKDGCKVILTGDSADELFSGYMHHHKYWLEGLL